MIYLLHTFLALTAFLVVLNGFLRGAKKAHVDVFLSILLVTLLSVSFVAFGWKAGLLAVVLSFIYASAFRPLAARVAARLLGRPGHTSARHIDLPPPDLQRVCRELGQRSSPEGIEHDLLSGSDRYESALEALLDYCEANPDTRKVMTEFNASRGTLLELYGTLLKAGAGQWAGGHYVPASALAHSHTLRYLLRYPASGRDALNQRACNLIAHFEAGSPLK